ncbi:stress-response A/B barrel domain-containing protein At5g22580-like [Bidens hawaiensis]|uniref:stress-response A/B barrel domain-containing protein At5g22580-like n=1 Tax=Bidens hawaiensis TaxID=980011 RepID=UPI0040490B6A
MYNLDLCHDSDTGVGGFDCGGAATEVLTYVISVIGRLEMGEFIPLVVVKFKEEVVVEDIIKGLEKLVSDVELVKSFVCTSSSKRFKGTDIESMEMLRQGFTHALMMTFGSKDDFNAFQAHPNHLEFSATFSTAIGKIVLLDFPAVVVKPPIA